VHVILAMVFLTVIGVTLWLARDRDSHIGPGPSPLPFPQPKPEIPVAPNANDLDPLVRRLIEKRTNELRANERDPVRWASLGHAFHANGLHAPAAACYETALSLEPSNPRWAYVRALLDADAGDFDAAIAGMNRVIALAADFVPAYWRAGFWHLDRDELDQAETMLSLASRLEEGNAIPLVGLALLARQRQQPTDVIVWLEPVVADWPDMPLVRHLLAEAYALSGRGDEAAAMRVGASDQLPRWHDDWEYPIEASRTGREVLIERARADLDGGRSARALPPLEEARAFWPDDPELLGLLGEAQLAQGDSAAALPILLLAAAQAASPSARVWAALGRAHADLEQWPDAAAALERAVQLDPAAGDHWLLLAQARLHLGRVEAAAIALREAQRLGTDNPGLVEMLEALVMPRAGRL
jgi:tetratricopeptide (TPR) repeat protein